MTVTWDRAGGAGGTGTGAVTVAWDRAGGAGGTGAVAGGPEAIGIDGVAALDALPLAAITQSPAFRVRASESLGKDTLTVYERS